jgi:hypothetical protein
LREAASRCFESAIGTTTITSPRGEGGGAIGSRITTPFDCCVASA